jgi:hypothetical protein
VADRGKKSPSQVMELFLSVSEALGHVSDGAIARLADAGPESVGNWRGGAVSSFKAQKLRAAIDSITSQIVRLRDQSGRVGPGRILPLTPIEIEVGASPTDIQRQFRERVHYDYLGHRFLYFEPQGALAWENLIRSGYEQNTWLAGVEDCAQAWLDVTASGVGTPKGPIAAALGLGRRERSRGLDVISLGAGEGGKEIILMSTLLGMAGDRRRQPAWVTMSLVDVSIPLLLTAARRSREVLADQPEESGVHSEYSIRPFCADFEEGPLEFVRTLPTFDKDSDGLRLVLVQGNVLGNLRDEETFVREKLSKLARPGDLVWVEVGLRPDDMNKDPLFATMSSEGPETAAQTTRRLLLEGPYRRWATASGRSPRLTTRIWLREDDETARIPGSVNFCHDLVLEDENRVCTMLYSRRYELEELTAWFEQRGYEILGIRRTKDSKGNPRVAHLLLRRGL